MDEDSQIIETLKHTETTWQVFQGKTHTLLFEAAVHESHRYRKYCPLEFEYNAVPCTTSGNTSRMYAIVGVLLKCSD